MFLILAVGENVNFLLLSFNAMSSKATSSPTLSPEAQATYNAESNLPFILGITITFHVLALIAVILRVYVRTFLVKVIGWDDYTMIGAMVR